MKIEEVHPTTVVSIVTDHPSQPASASNSEAVRMAIPGILTYRPRAERLSKHGAAGGGQLPPYY